MAEKPGIVSPLTRQQELLLAAAAAVEAARQAAGAAGSAPRAESFTALRESLSRLLETREQDLELTEDIEQPSASSVDGVLG